jgi:ADP-ribosylglycohydrolase
MQDIYSKSWIGNTAMDYIGSNFKEYQDKVYAGVLGKIIGVYMGRPFEAAPHELVMKMLGEVWYYTHEKRNVPLIVTDDDITGTFAFLRALEDYSESGKDLTARQIGETWLNYVIEGRTIFWWGGTGVSTEHTAYQRLVDGYEAPRSGSVELNGRVVAEQIGAQIFIDGWALVTPGDPDTAAKLAKEAGSVSHDGEAVYGAQMIAVMESCAFVEKDISKLIEKALSYIPADSQVAGIVRDMVRLHQEEPDWKKAVAYLYKNYPYEKYGGFCPMVSNHGLIVLSLLYGDDDFQKTQMIVNTGGWDTDCNAANVGCIMGIKNGLESINRTADFRGPVADRLYLPTAEGGRGISDALEVAQWITNLGAGLYGHQGYRPKDGAKFNFEAPGAVQGFTTVKSPDHLEGIRIGNQEGISRKGTHTLAVDFNSLSPGQKVEVTTPTGVPLEHYTAEPTTYDLIASPTLFSGQTVKASVYWKSLGTESIMIRLMTKVVTADPVDNPRFTRPQFREDSLCSEPIELNPGKWKDLEFTIPETRGAPVTCVGLRLLHSGGNQRSASGTLHVDYIDWSGVPEGYLWKNSWTNYAVDKTWCSSADQCFQIPSGDTPIIMLKTKGRGFLTQGNRSWKDYRVEADMSARLFRSGGLVAYYQGQNRFLSLTLCDDRKLRLTQCVGSETTILDETDFTYQLDANYSLNLEIEGNSVKGGVDDTVLLQGTFDAKALSGGSCGMVVERGSLDMKSFRLN